MNRQNYLQWLHEQARGVLGQREKADGFRAALAAVAALEQHLREQCGIQQVEAVTLEALHSFTFDDQRNDDHHLRRLFDYLARPELVQYVDEVSARKYFQRKTLAVIFKAMPRHRAQSAKLKNAGIRTPAELVERGATPAGRQQIAQATGLAPETVLELVHCCDLCRMTGMAGQALRRSVALGYTTLAKYRQADPEEIRRALAQYLAAHHEQSNTMIDFATFIHQARRLPEQVRN
jgi:hypothetical protein